jgi:hypothetical protein
MIIASPVVLLNKTEIVSLWILLIGSLWGLGMMRKNFFRQLVQTRKSWNLIQLYLSLALLFPFLSYNNDLSNWIIAALPLSSLISCAFFYPERRIFPMVYHWILFLLAFFSEYFVK